MRIFLILGVIFYATVLILIGLLFVVYSFNLIKTEEISNFLLAVSSNLNYRIISALIGILLILISFSFAQMILGWYQKEKNIAFFTPTGQVTVSLSAVEDLIKKSTVLIPEIRDLRAEVFASKKGILVNLRVILKSEVNLPELTSRLQDLTRSKLQEILGLEEPINVKIHIAKIIPEEKTKRRKEADMEEKINIPFSGYGKI